MATRAYTVVTPAGSVKRLPLRTSLEPSGSAGLVKIWIAPRSPGSVPSGVSVTSSVAARGSGRSSVIVDTAKLPSPTLPAPWTASSGRSSSRVPVRSCAGVPSAAGRAFGNSVPVPSSWMVATPVAESMSVLVAVSVKVLLICGRWSCTRAVRTSSWWLPPGMPTRLPGT